MLGALLLIALQPVSSTQSEVPDQIILKMLTKYAYAESLSGNISFTVDDGAGKVTIKTVVKYVRPNLLYIKQDRTGENGLKQTAISDGSAFMYDPPVNSKVVVNPNERLYEIINFTDEFSSAGFRRNVGQLYSIAHMSLSPSTALDIAIGFTPHLKDLQIHLSTRDKLQKATYKDKVVFKITGEWRINRSTAKANGNYVLLVSHDYDFLRLVHTARYNIGKVQAGTDRVDPKNIVIVTTTEEADLKVDAKVGTQAFNYREKAKYDLVLGWH